MEKNRRFDIPRIPKGNVDQITTKIVKSGRRQAQDVVSGKLDYMQDPPPSDMLPTIRSKYRDRYEEHVTVSSYYFFLNTREEPFDKEQVRDAVNYALDSRALARIFGGRLEPSCNYLPSNIAGYEEIDPCPYGDPSEPGDLERARELVEDAGESGTDVKVWTNNDPTRPEIGQYLTDLLNKIGLKAELETVDGGVYLQNIGSARTKAQIGHANWFQDFPHPGNFLFPVHGDSIQPTNNQNYGNVDDRELNRLIDRVQQGAADDSEVKEAAAEADRLLVEKSYMAPYGSEKLSTFLAERMDLENCSRFHPVYQNDYSSFCLR
jgi:peptide/nickel transport system substrate-binding protein